MITIDLWLGITLLLVALLIGIVLGSALIRSHSS